MLSFLHSIFGSGTTAEGYPESLVKAAIERAVDGTDPWIRAVSGYKRTLRPAVIRAIDYVLALVDGMESPVVLEPGTYSGHPLLRTVFSSSADLLHMLAADRNLAELFTAQGEEPSVVVAALVTEKRETVIAGAELAGTIVLRDVPQVAVSFEAQRLVDPAPEERLTRRLLKKRAFDHLLSLALGRIGAVKTERDELERYRLLLQAKLDLLRRGGWGFSAVADDDRLDVAELEDLLGKIETQLQELGGVDGMLEFYLGIVVEVLSNPHEHLWFRQETLLLDRMGVKRGAAAGDVTPVTIDLICNDVGASLVVALVTVPARLFASR